MQRARAGDGIPAPIRRPSGRWHGSCWPSTAAATAAPPTFPEFAMHTQPRAQLASQLDDLQAAVPILLDSGPLAEQCAHIVARAAGILHRAGSLDRDYVTDRLAWILAKLPPTGKPGHSYDVDKLALHDPVSMRRRGSLGLDHRSVA
jgi:hypothetical protein